MTEIQWLVDVLLHQKMPQKIRDIFIARIGEVELTLARQQPPRITPLVAQTAQAPSTQRLLEHQEVPQVVKPTPGTIDKETGRVNIPTGNGTSGPRKW